MLVKVKDITCLDDLLNSDEYNNSRFGSSSDDWIQDSERMERLDIAAQDGCDGSTHAEHMDDWRECLGRLDLPDAIKDKINIEIDSCEQWHIANGSIDDQCS